MITASKLISVGFLFIGVFLLMQIVSPLVSFQLWTIGQKVNSQILISPKKTSEQVLGVSIQNKGNFLAFVSSLKRETQANYSVFNITIPKIKMDKNPVLVDSNDLSSSLAHLPGSSLPGEKGNVFISGHSALSPLFSFKVAPFAKLVDLKKGDQIFVEASGAKFTYQVTDLKVVSPDDLSVISPPDTMGRYISLMTCVPPGLNLKRLVILGKMI